MSPLVIGWSAVGAGQTWGASATNRKAKYYRLTAAGKAQLSRERDRWTQLVGAIGRIMNPSPTEE